MLATLAGLAERDMFADTANASPGKTVRELFLTKKVNKAGCYAMKMVINGEERTIIVDDYLPVKVNKKGLPALAFSKSSKGENEMWMMLVEKAWAKVCGSYEASERGHVADAFHFLAGGPGHTYRLQDFKSDIKRGPRKSDERFDKFWRLLEEANLKGWVTTATTSPMPDSIKLVD